MTRIPEQNLIQSKPWVVDENDPALQFLDKTKVVIRKSDGTTYDKYLSIPPIVGESSSALAIAQIATIDLTGGTALIKPDTIELKELHCAFVQY